MRCIPCWVPGSTNLHMPGPMTALMQSTRRIAYLFCRLVKFVRFPHLSPHYLAAVVTACPLAAKSDLLPYMLSLSLANRKSDGGGANLVAEDRGRGSSEYTFTSTLALVDVLTLKPGAGLYTFVGLVDGFPLRLQANHYQQGGKTSFGVFLYVLLPVWKTKEWEGGERQAVNVMFTLQTGEI